VHGGYHYPRNFLTALRSNLLQQRFYNDFRSAVKDDFEMIYAIARRRSKVSVGRFQRMFEELGAPISLAAPVKQALFNSDLIESAFSCREFAFDYSILKRDLNERLEQESIRVLFDTMVNRVEACDDEVQLELQATPSIRAKHVFNVTYANLNAVNLRSGLASLKLKHELAEVAMIRPPDAFRDLAVTVMDGPFFSSMPFPANDLYSLTHVRYTPHFSWIDTLENPSAYEVANSTPQLSRWKHMMLDAQRYIPSFADLEYVESLFDVKTVLVENERDDGRPILLHQHEAIPNYYSIMGAKIDNIYDLFDALKESGSVWRGANSRHLFQ